MRDPFPAIVLALNLEPHAPASPSCSSTPSREDSVCEEFSPRFLAGFVVCGVLVVLFAFALYFGGAWDHNRPAAQLPTAPPAPDPAPAPVTRPEPAPVVVRTRKPVPAKLATSEDNLALENVYRAKFESPDYAQWMAMTGIPKGNQSSLEERAVQAELRRLAAKVQAPANATILEIPV